MRCFNALSSNSASPRKRITAGFNALPKTRIPVCLIFEMSQGADIPGIPGNLKLPGIPVSQYNTGNPGKQIILTNPDNVKCEKLEAKSRHYLVRMGLFKALNISSGIDILEHEPAGRFIPLTQIRASDDLTRFIAEMIPLLHLKQEQAWTIGYIVSELGRNVIEHADSKNGAFLCAQYYTKSNTIRIGIADRGVGIKTAINQSYHTKTDLEALGMALSPGITGTTRREGGSEQNAGAGLFFIKSIAQVNRDFFIIYSGSAVYKLLKQSQNSKLHLNADPFRDRHSTDANLPYWNGTLVGIDINLNQKEEFVSLLDEIHKVYTNAIRERKKAKHRKPKFI